MKTNKYMSFGHGRSGYLRSVEDIRNMKGDELPDVKRLKESVATEENRDFLADTIHEIKKSIWKPPVRSNAELIERIDEYFTTVENRRVPPTIEELALYLGWTIHQFEGYRNGVYEGFPDRPVPGVDTVSALERVTNAMHGIDAVQVTRRKTDVTSYIFRSKNYYGMKDNREAPIQINLNTPNALPPEQIAKLLPEIAQDSSLDDVDIQ